MNKLVRTVLSATLAAGALAGVASADVCTTLDLATFGIAAAQKTEGTKDAQGDPIDCPTELAAAFDDSSKFSLDTLCRCIKTLIDNDGMDDLPDCDIEQFADVAVGVPVPPDGINLKSSYSDLCQAALPGGPTEVGEGEDCNYSVAPQYQTHCGAGFECKMPVMDVPIMGASGVCTKVAETGGPTEVGEDEECNYSVAPEFQKHCGAGFECKMPVMDELVVGGGGVCTKVAGTGGQGPTSGGDDSCTSDSDCKDGKKCGKISKKCVVPGSGGGGGNPGGGNPGGGNPGGNQAEGGAQNEENEEESEEPSDVESTNSPNSPNSTTTVATAESGAAGIEAAAVAAAAVVGFLGAL